MLKTRNRLVNFRLTQDEYDKIQAALLAKGMRCLSDFARDAVLRFAEADAVNGDSANTHLVHLDRRVAELEASVRELQAMLPERRPKTNGAEA